MGQFPHSKHCVRELTSGTSPKSIIGVFLRKVRNCWSRNPRVAGVDLTRSLLSGFRVSFQQTCPFWLKTPSRSRLASSQKLVHARVHYFHSPRDLFPYRSSRIDRTQALVCKGNGSPRGGREGRYHHHRGVTLGHACVDDSQFPLEIWLRRATLDASIPNRKSTPPDNPPKSEDRLQFPPCCHLQKRFSLPRSGKEDHGIYMGPA